MRGTQKLVLMNGVQT